MKALQRILIWDEALFLAICRWQRPWLNHLMRSLTHFGDPISWTLVALILIALGSDVSRQAAFLLGGGAGIASAISATLKRLSKRRRPDVGIEGFKALALNPDAYSFPSGHTSAAFAVALSVTGVAPGLASFLVFLACAIAFSRIYLGAHYPLDVGVGAAIGAVSGIAARFSLPWLMFW